MIFICYPKCTTCKKAQAWLDAKGIKYTLRNIKEHNPTAEELKLWHTNSSKELKNFFNTSGLLYKSMNLKEKLPSMSDKEKFALLGTDGMLVKRPLLISHNKVLIGFKEKEWEEALL